MRDADGGDEDQDQCRADDVEDEEEDRERGGDEAEQDHEDPGAGDCAEDEVLELQARLAWVDAAGEEAHG